MIRANLRKSILMSRGRLLWNLVGCKLLLCRITFPQLLQLPSYEFFSSRNLGRWRNLGARALGSWQPILTIGCNFKENIKDILKKFWKCIEEIKQKFWINLGVGIWLFLRLTRLQRYIATINCWTDYCNNREIIVVIIGCLKKIAK